MADPAPTNQRGFVGVTQLHDVVPEQVGQKFTGDGGLLLGDGPTGRTAQPFRQARGSFGMRIGLLIKHCNQ